MSCHWPQVTRWNPRVPTPLLPPLRYCLVRPKGRVVSLQRRGIPESSALCFTHAKVGRTKNSFFSVFWGKNTLSSLPDGQNPTFLLCARNCQEGKELSEHTHSCQCGQFSVWNPPVSTSHFSLPFTWHLASRRACYGLIRPEGRHLFSQKEGHSMLSIYTTVATQISE